MSLASLWFSESGGRCREQVCPQLCPRVASLWFAGPGGRCSDQLSSQLSSHGLLVHEIGGPRAVPPAVPPGLCARWADPKFTQCQKTELFGVVLQR